MQNSTIRVTATSKHLLQKNFNSININSSTEEFTFKSSNNRVTVNSALSVLTSGILTKLINSNNDLNTENRAYFPAKALNIQEEVHVNKERMSVVSRRSGKNNFSAVNYRRIGLNKESIYNIFSDMHSDSLFLNEKFYKNIVGVRSYSHLQKSFQNYPEYKIVLSNLTKFIDRAIFEVANDTAKDLVGCYTPNSYSIHKYVDNFRNKSDNRLVDSKRLFLDIWDAIDDYSSDWYSKWNDYNLHPEGFKKLVQSSDSLTSIRNYELFYGLKYYGDQLEKHVWLLRTGKNSHLNTVFGSATRISFLKTISKKYLERDYTVAAKKNFGFLRSMFLKTWFPANSAEAATDYINFNPFYLTTLKPYSSHVVKVTDKFSDNTTVSNPKIIRSLNNNSTVMGVSNPIRVNNQRQLRTLGVFSRLLRRTQKTKLLVKKVIIGGVKLIALCKPNVKKKKYLGNARTRWRLNSRKYKTVLINALTLSVREDRIPDLSKPDTSMHDHQSIISKVVITPQNDTSVSSSSYSKLLSYGTLDRLEVPNLVNLNPNSVFDFVNLERLIVTDLCSTNSISRTYDSYVRKGTSPVKQNDTKTTLLSNKKKIIKFDVKLLLGVLHSLCVVRNKFLTKSSTINLIVYSFLLSHPVENRHVMYSSSQYSNSSRFTAIFTNYYLQRKLRKINRKENIFAVKPLFPNYILDRALAANVDFERFSDKFFDVVVEINESMQKAGYIFNPVLKYLFYKAMLGRFRASPTITSTTTDCITSTNSIQQHSDIAHIKQYLNSIGKSSANCPLELKCNKNNSIMFSEFRSHPKGVVGSLKKIISVLSVRKLPRILNTRYQYLFNRSKKLFLLKQIDIISANRDIKSLFLGLQTGSLRLSRLKNKSIVSLIKSCLSIDSIDRSSNVSFLDNFLNPYIDNLMHYRVETTTPYCKFSKSAVNKISMLFITKRLTKLSARTYEKTSLYLKNMRFNFLYKVSQQSTAKDLYYDKYIIRNQQNNNQQFQPANQSLGTINRQAYLSKSTDNIIFSRLNPKAASFFNSVDYPTTQIFLNKWKEHHIGGLQTFLNYEFLRLIPDEAKSIAVNSDCVLDRALLPIYRTRKTHARVMKSFYFNNEAWFKNPKHNFLSQSHTQFYNRRYPDFWYKPGRKKYPLKRGKKNWAIKIPLASRTNPNKGRLLNSFYDSSLTYLRFIGWHSWTRNTKRLKSLESIYRYGRDGDPYARSPLADIWSTTYQIGDLTKYDSFIMARSHANNPIVVTSYHGHSNNPDISTNLSHNYKNAYRGYSHNRVITAVKHLHFVFRSYNSGFKTWFKRVKPFHNYSGIKTYYQYQSYIMQQNNEIKTRRYKTIFSNFAFTFRLNKTMFSKNLVTLNFFDFANRVNSITGYDLCSMYNDSIGLDTVNNVYYRSIMSKFKYRPVFTSNTNSRDKLGATPNSLIRISRNFNKKYGSLIHDYSIINPRNSSKSVMTSDSRLRFINRINKSNIALNNYIKKLDIKYALKTVTAKNALWW